MELRQLKYFAKLAETLNFSDAARQLFISQSTLSQQIKQLEQELNTQLFQRDNHKVTLTEPGREMLPCALHTLHSAETCVDRVRDLQELLVGTLNIGVTYTFSPILTETLLDFMRQYPKVKLNICYKPMEELMDMLREQKVDFALAFKPTLSYDDIESHILFDNHLSVIVSQDHPMAYMEKVTLEDLHLFEWALPSKGLQARNTWEQALTNTILHLRVRIELNEVQILLKLIKQSKLATILSEASTHDETGIKSIPLDIPGSEMAGCVHLLKSAYRKHSALRFICMLSESNAIRERVRDWM